MDKPTQKTYGDFGRAYDLFNDYLFAGTLPSCMITMQRKSRTYGYFAGDRFGVSGGGGTVDEIALNPAHFRVRTTEEVLSTLVHEMVHLWQHRFGTPSQTGYHNKEWALKMEKVGLVPSDTGENGGKKTGQHMSHYIRHNDAFDSSSKALIWVELILILCKYMG